MSPHDPVEEFFARERREVRDLPGGRDRWEGIVNESRRPASRGWLPYLGAAAAAAVVVGAIGYGTTANRSHDTTPATASHRVTATVTQTVTAPATGPSPAPSPNPSSAGPSRTTTPAGPLPAPVSFEAASISNAGDGHLYAMGSATCGGKGCVAVVGSDDDGATWTTRASFEDFVTRGPRQTPDRGNQLTGIRFAGPQVGYLYGSVVWRTTDGGRHWSRFDVGGQRVLSLETDGDTVWFVTARACRHGKSADQRGCSGLAVWSAPVDATRASKVRALGLGHDADGAWLSLDGSDAYVSASYADQSVQPLPQRVSGTPTTLPRPQGCATTGGVWVWGTARADGHLVAVCATGAGPTRTYAVSSSADRGRTWSPAAPAPDLGPVDGSGVWVTAVDPKRLVAVPRGLPTSSDQPDQQTGLLSSGDAGRTWSAPRGAEASQSWSWAGAAGGGLVYALGGGPGSFEVSTDSGASFVARPFRG
jgi:hypothetical protein